MSLYNQGNTNAQPEQPMTPTSVRTTIRRPETGTQWPLILEEPLSQENTPSDCFRPIHYLGSKLRMIDSIVEAIDKLDPNRGRVCDLFAGSGTVAGMLARTRCVTTVDIQEYSRVLCSALVFPILSADRDGLNLDAVGNPRLEHATESIVHYEQESIKLALLGYPDMLNDFLEHCSLARFMTGEFGGSDPLREVLTETTSRLHDSGLAFGNSSLTTRMFGGVYFAYSQAIQLDALLDAAFSAPSSRRDILLAAVLSTASEIVNTIGKQFAQPIRLKDRHGLTKGNLLSKISKDRSANVRASFTKWLNKYQTVNRTQQPHSVIRSDYAEALSWLHEDTKVIYADPPYTRDHYSRYYHVLETLALRDNPAVAKVRIGGVERMSRGIYRVDRHQSPFCIPSQVTDAFRILFSKVARRRLPLILSYSPYREGSDARPRLMTLDEIKSLAGHEFRNVTIETLGPFSHNKLNNARLNKSRTQFAESLIICRP